MKRIEAESLRTGVLAVGASLLVVGALVVSEVQEVAMVSETDIFVQSKSGTMLKAKGDTYQIQIDFGCAPTTPDGDLLQISHLFRFYTGSLRSYYIQSGRTLEPDINQIAHCAQQLVSPFSWYLLGGWRGPLKQTYSQRIKN